ncbi:MAG: SPFH domain-containing protein [Oscillospiraceae bacterium]
MKTAEITKNPTGEKVIVEKELNPANGILMLLLNIFVLMLSVAFIVCGPILLSQGRMLGLVSLIGGLILLVTTCIMFGGFKTVRPNEALVLTLFGGYHGTIRRAGFFLVNPFCTSVNPNYDNAKSEAVHKNQEAQAQGRLNTVSVNARKSVSLKTMAWNNGTQKVNDVLGNPIIIGAVVFWKVTNPTAAVFSVENYPDYLSTQTDSTIRNIARLYPYDDMENENGAEDEKTLRGSSQEIANRMKDELQDRVSSAGLTIDEVRITHLSYSEEIAAAMLQRQQATAIIAARQKIVDGAVGMVKMAIDKLGEDNIVVLDEERKAAMVSNLLVVLCGNRDVQPIVNSGSIY